MLNKLFSTKTNVGETKLVKDALRNMDVPIDEALEVIDVSQDENHKHWLKGFRTGYGTAICGLALGYGIGKLIIKVAQK